MLLSDSQAIDGYSESGTECPPHQWGKLTGGVGEEGADVMFNSPPSVVVC